MNLDISRRRFFFRQDTEGPAFLATERLETTLDPMGSLRSDRKSKDLLKSLLELLHLVLSRYF